MIEMYSIHYYVLRVIFVMICVEEKEHRAILPGRKSLALLSHFVLHTLLYTVERAAAAAPRRLGYNHNHWQWRIVIIW